MRVHCICIGYFSVAVKKNMIKAAYRKIVCLNFVLEG